MSIMDVQQYHELLILAFVNVKLQACTPLGNEHGSRTLAQTNIFLRQISDDAPR
jgi:hypothetical protein